jgi:hypothetical protein
MTGMKCHYLMSNEKTDSAHQQQSDSKPGSDVEGLIQNHVTSVFPLRPASPIPYLLATLSGTCANHDTRTPIRGAEYNQV